MMPGRAGGMSAEQLSAAFDLMQSHIDNVGKKEVYGFCAACKGEIDNPAFVLKRQFMYHRRCFACTSCKKDLEGAEYVTIKGVPYCPEDFEIKTYTQICSVCDKRITDQLIEADGKLFHTGCFRCAKCHCEILENQFFIHDGRYMCERDYLAITGPVCGRCGEAILEQRAVGAGDQVLHASCFVCEVCRAPFDAFKAYQYDGMFFCEMHHPVQRPANSY